MQLQKIRMTLTTGLEGKTVVLRKRKFVNGVHEAVIPAKDIDGLKKYFTICYQVKFENLSVEIKEEHKEKDNHAIKVDDSAVLGDDKKKAKKEEKEIVDEPNTRQQAIIAAVNKVEKEKWIEQDTNPHPKVVDVSTIMADPTVTKEEICEVITKWLS